MAISFEPSKAYLTRFTAVLIFSSIKNKAFFIGV